MPDKFLTLASSVIPAKAGIQWFNKPFPRSGNDNRNDNRTRASVKPCHPFTPRSPLLDSSFRWNDDEEQG